MAVLSFSLKYNDVELYPDNVFDWKFTGVNCATEDYSIGSINNIVLTYTTNIKPVKDLITGEFYPVYVDNYYFVIRDVTRVKGQNKYTVTCASDYYDLDQPLPNSFVTPVDGETAGELFYRLQGVSGAAPYPYLSVNKNYVINPNWYQKGMTLRQAYMYISQIVGVNIKEFLKNKDLPMPRSIEGIYKLQAPNEAVDGDTLFFTPQNVKDIEIADYTVPTITGLYAEQPTPIDLRGGNDLYLPYNPIANPSDDSWASNLNTYLQAAPSYTPMKLTTWTDAHTINSLGSQPQIRTVLFWSRQYNWMKYTDADNNVYYCPIYNWELSPSGLVLEGTGNIIRPVDSGYTPENEAVSQINEIYDRFLFKNYLNANTETLSVPSGQYIVATTQYGANSSVSDGMWLVMVTSSYYHYSTILAPSDGTSIAVGPNQITITRGSAKTTFSCTRVGGT